MEIMTIDLSDDVRPIPNPVRTFDEAFQNFRKLVLHYGTEIL